MPTPLLESIAENLLTTLKGISVSGGYHNDVAEVVRRRQFSTYTKDRQLIITQGESVRDDESNPRNGFITWIQEFEIAAIVVESETGDAVDTRINSIRADIERAVMEDPFRGGLAHDTWPNGAVPMPDETGGQIAGVAVSIMVRYRTQLTDPNTQA